MPESVSTLESILSARERRAENQKILLQRFSAPLISYMINTPGAVKNSPLTITIFNEGLNALRQKLAGKGMETVNEDVNYFTTGAEAIISVEADETLLKQLAVDIEESHPLGRLFDFDIISMAGNPVSREAVGFPRRKCFLCEEDASICVRSRKHTIESLVEKIKIIAENYYGI